MTERHLGVWSLQRSIVDLQTGATFACRGQACLIRDAGELRYDEAVILTLNGAEVKATQTYRYRRSGARITARFADGRMFFVTTLAPDGSATALHYCAQDVYVGTFALSDDRWAAHWAVSGTKSLHIHTAYTRGEIT